MRLVKKNGTLMVDFALQLRRRAELVDAKKKLFGWWAVQLPALASS